MSGSMSVALDEMDQKSDVLHDTVVTENEIDFVCIKIVSPICEVG